MADIHGVDPAAVQFDAPLRGPHGRREPRGSDLLVRETVRQLITWLRVGQQPHLVVILIDSDGDANGRRSQVDAHVEGHPAQTLTVTAIAVQEFEAWLSADAAAGVVAGATLQAIVGVEELPPGEAKRRLSAAVPRGLDALAVRRSIARHADLDAVRQACPSFNRFCKDLARVGVPGGRTPAG